MQRRRLNIKLLIGLVGGMAVTAVGVYFLHEFQMDLNAQKLKESAQRYAAAGDLRKAKSTLMQYVLIRPKDREQVAAHAEIAADITELPADWPDDYKNLVERRIEAIESNPQIALIEQPEYKRRRNTEPWDSQVERALRSWLLDRLDSYFDFDGRLSEGLTQRREGAKPKEKQSLGDSTPLREIQLVSVAKLADVASRDPDGCPRGGAARVDASTDGGLLEGGPGGGADGGAARSGVEPNDGPPPPPPPTAAPTGSPTRAAAVGAGGSSS